MIAGHGRFPGKYPRAVGLPRRGADHCPGVRKNGAEPAGKRTPWLPRPATLIG
jgi:hypothetical protein